MKYIQGYMSRRPASTQDLKQVLIIRSDLKMGKGKIAAQASHASVIATLEALHQNKIWFDQWKKHGMAKIAVKVTSEEELHGYYQRAIKAKLPKALINDAGHTQLAPGTATAVAIGPAPSSIIDTITKDLKLL